MQIVGSGNHKSTQFWLQDKWATPVQGNERDLREGEEFKGGEIYKNEAILWPLEEFPATKSVEDLVQDEHDSTQSWLQHKWATPVQGYE